MSFEFLIKLEKERLRNQKKGYSYACAEACAIAEAKTACVISVGT
jgi:hypothetical protein